MRNVAANTQKYLVDMLWFLTRPQRVFVPDYGIGHLLLAAHLMQKPLGDDLPDPVPVDQRGIYLYIHTYTADCVCCSHNLPLANFINPLRSRSPRPVMRETVETATIFKYIIFNR